LRECAVTDEAGSGGGTSPQGIPLRLARHLYRPESRDEILRHDRALADLLFVRALVPAADLEACLRLQAERAEATGTPFPRLRQILLERGLLAAEGIDQANESLDGTPAEASAAASFARFRLVERLGRGGMGEVWKAWDPAGGRWVALKILQQQSPEDLARFRREGEMAGRLDHPHIATIYEVGHDPARPYISMRYVEGMTLEKLPRHDRRRLVRLLRDAARAVAHAHRQGIVHRDLKPSNLLVSQDTVYVADFGLAKRIGDAGGMSATGMLLGTMGYMSPEQASGGPVDGRTDVYSLGATLFEVLAGRLPFAGGDLFEVLRQLQDKEAPPLRAIDPTVDRDLTMIVARCLEKEPDRRYPTADALADDLERWLNGEEVHARPATTLERLARFVKRRRRAVAALAASAAIAGVAAIVLAVGRARESAREELLLKAREAWEEVPRFTALRLRREAQAKASEARGRLERANGLRPSADVHAFIGRCLLYEGRVDDAVAAWKGALSLDPACEEALFHLGLARGSAGAGAWVEFDRRDLKVGDNPQELVAADLDGDGRLDLAVTNYFDNDVSVCLAAPPGGLSEGRRWKGNLYRPHGIAAADLDGDGKADLAITNVARGNIAVLLGSGDGDFTEVGSVLVGTFPLAPAIADFDGDGKPDLAASNYEEGSVSVMPATGGGAFGPGAELRVGPNPHGLAAADFDADGCADLAVAVSGASFVTILKGQRVGGMALGRRFPCGAGPTGIEAADLDGDGKTDVVTANRSAGTISWLRGRGDGTFEPAVEYAAGAYPIALSVVDLDGDGKLDVAVACLFSESLSVLRGTGSGRLGEIRYLKARASPHDICGGDFDGDGMSDLAVLNHDDNSVTLFAVRGHAR
jgi:predicted Ser/Thr protein kinase/tetratricopeptide (TPR) repeat protein